MILAQPGLGSGELPHDFDPRCDSSPLRGGLFPLGLYVLLKA